MIRALLVTFTVLALFSACTQRMICPAFQSAYIYDKDALRKKFSYFREDSTPKILTASKTKYLIAEPVTYRKKIRSMYTIPMKPVNPLVPDSLRTDYGEDIVPGAELDLAARSVIDSIYIEDVHYDDVENAEDSVYVITKDKEIRVLKYNYSDSLIYDPNTGKYINRAPKYEVAEVRFNVDQDNYMWYLREYLVLPDVRIARMKQSERAEAEKETKEKKGFKGFFKNLFKKKKKEEIDSTQLQKPVRADDDFDYVEEEETLQYRQSEEAKPVKEKKGLFSRKKSPADKPKTSNGDDTREKPAKKKKEKKAKQPTEEEPEKKKEDEDDGFDF